MTHPLYVAFIWHQHQPLYKSSLSTNDFGGQYRLPWVRLHGIKDYLDLVLILEKYPLLHQTVNLVPSLILQLEEYANGTAIDPYLALTLTPVSELTTEQKQYIIAHFFDANHYRLICPHARYEQLYQQRHLKGEQWCYEYWQDQDYSDLLAFSIYSGSNTLRSIPSCIFSKSTSIPNLYLPSFNLPTTTA